MNKLTDLELLEARHDKLIEIKKLFVSVCPIAVGYGWTLFKSDGTYLGYSINGFQTHKMLKNRHEALKDALDLLDKVEDIESVFEIIPHKILFVKYINENYR